MNDSPGATLPERDAFVMQLAPAAPRAKPVRELHALLSAAEPAATLAERVMWLDKLVRWLGRGALPALGHESVPHEPHRSARLRLLVHALEHAPPFRARVAQLVAAVLAESSGFQLLSRVGLPGDRSFMAETADRISRRFLPAVRDEHELSQLLARFFPKASDASWLAGLDPALVARLLAALDAGQSWRPLASAAADAALLLATRISALGLSDDIRVRSPRLPLRESPLFRLPRATDALLALIEGDAAAPPERLHVALLECKAQLEASEQTVLAVTRNLEQFGVSVDVVYRLEVMAKNMQRLRLLLLVLAARASEERAARVCALAGRLIEDRIRDRSPLDLARTSLHLLARKIIERAGHTGEHYITDSRREYLLMLASAAGGGVLTAGTASLKFVVGWAKLPPFVEGLVSGANYAGSFLLMQALGFTLATKQPSMTAAALAASLGEAGGKLQLGELVTMIARITRSQLAAAMGNIGLVIPAALIVDQVFASYQGRHFLDAETAKYVLHTLHPTEGGAIGFAALTGVLLWSSSIFAGWLENWAVYRRIPEALAQHRIKRFVGERTTLWFSRVFARNISGVGGNVSLGFMLSMTPVFGKFIGLPLDVRHVTLSTGALVLAFNSLQAEATQHGLYAAMLGIALIALCNFGVSFVLALLVALRAKEVALADQLRLLGAVISRFFSNPREFFLPP